MGITAVYTARAPRPDLKCAAGSAEGELGAAWDTAVARIKCGRVSAGVSRGPRPSTALPVPIATIVPALLLAASCSFSHCVLYKC